MCFSSTVSFTSASILIPLGVYSLTKSIKIKEYYTLFASIPLIFGIHQLVEGLIWIRLQSSDVLTVHYLSLFYLFVALIVWPCLVPLAANLIETNAHRKLTMKFLSVFGLCFGSIFYFSLVSQIIPTNTSIVNNSISYVQYQNKLVIISLLLIYAGIILLPLFISSIKMVNRLGILILASMFATIFWYFYALTSVWCFFSALISLYIVYSIRKLAA